MDPVAVGLKDVLNGDARVSCDTPEGVGNAGLTPAVDGTEAERAADALANVAREVQDEYLADVPAAGADTPLAQAVAADTRKRIALSGRNLPRPSTTRA